MISASKIENVNMHWVSGMVLDRNVWEYHDSDVKSEGLIVGPYIKNYTHWVISLYKYSMNLMQWNAE